MTNINEQDLLDEIRFDIKNKDLLKGKLVLASLENVNRETQKKALFEVSKADDDFAIPLLAGVISKSPKISTSFPHLREAMFSRILDNPDILLKLLSETDDSSVKAFLVEIAGEIRFKKALTLIMDMLNDESDIVLIKSIITSIGMIGDPSSVFKVSEFLYSANDGLMESAARALGEIATPEAIKKLASRLGNNAELDLIIIDIIAKIQIPQALQALNDLLSSKNAHLRVASKQKIGEIGVMSVRILTKNLLQDNSDLVIHSLNVLGDIGDPAAIPAIRNLLYGHPKDPNVRFAAFEALGRLPLDKGAFTLAAGLEDPIENVRSAAAKAIDKNYNSVLAGGVRNLIRPGDSAALNIIKTILDSLCGNIFLDLIEDDIFKVPALKYLSGNAHPDVRLHYAQILEESGYKDLLKQLRTDEKAGAKTRLKVFAVDDSKMILNIYRTVLHNMGCDSKLFEFPAEALKQIRLGRPDVVLTDLNMPEITGIDLTKTIRQYFSKETLPIIMVTTQKEDKDNNAAYEAGVNGILQKPFTESMIKKALIKFTGTCFD